MKTENIFSIKYALFALFMLFSATVMGQVQVTGTVSDEFGPVLGATVREKGTQNGTATDMDGKFQLKVKNVNATLSISFVGYKSQNVNLAGRTSVNVTLKADAQMLDETVVVGYGKMKRSDLAGASTTLDNKALEEGNITNIDQAFQGRVAGVTSIATSGAPGSSQSIRVRGQATINAGAEPLYVIDGVIFQGSAQKGADLGLGDRLGNGSVSTVSPLSTINPADIISMEILKDASATAIYGAQGSNGVVLITTKRGKSGEAKFTYDGSVTMSRQMKRLDMMNLREFATYYNTLVDQGEITANSADPMYSDPSVLGIGTNWQDAVFRTAWQHNHQISAQGGTDKVQYYVSGNFMNQEGTILRANLDAQLKPWLKLGLNASYTATSDNLKLADSDEGIINYSLVTPPDIQIYNIDGGYSSVSKEGFTNPNPIAMAMLNEILLDRQKLNGSIFADVTLLKNLVWHAELGWDLSWSKGSTYEPKVDLGTWVRDNNNGRIQKNSSTYWTVKNYLTWNEQFGKHSISAMLGQECWESKWDHVSVYNTGLPSDAVHNPALGSGKAQIGSGFGSSAMASFFTRETYNYDDRYLATYTFRYDGSSNFGPNKRWAPFHSVAVAWRFTNEKFMKDLTWLSNGKLRLGWGQTGNANIGGYKWGSAMSTMDTSLGMSYRPANMANLDIQWETQEQLNVGLDLGFFNGDLGLTVDWYKKMSKNMLMPMTLPSIMGTGGNGSSALAAPWGNYGDIENSGLEITINAHPVRTKDFSWDTDLNFSTNKNKVKSLAGGVALVGYGQWTDVVTRSAEGDELYAFYGYKTDGVYTSFEDLISSPVDMRSNSNPVVTNADGTKSWSTNPGDYNPKTTTYIGDVKFVDVNGDGIIDENDKTKIGSAMPKWTFGWNNTFRYKNLDLTVFVNGSIGNKVGNYMKMKLTHMNSPWQNQLVDCGNHALLAPKNGQAVDNWYYDASNVIVTNPDCAYPRASINDPSDNDVWSDRFIEDGSYIRLSYVTLGYDLSKLLARGCPVKGLNVTLTGRNLFLLTKYSGSDPQVTESGSAYGSGSGGFDRYGVPKTRSFNLSVKATF